MVCVSLVIIVQGEETLASINLIFICGGWPSTNTTVYIKFY